MKFSTKIKQIIAFIIGVCILAGLDQWTKYIAETKLKGNAPFVIIDGVLEFSYLRNTGAAWGILSGGRIILISLTVIIMIVIGYLVYRTPVEKKYLPFRVILMMVLAGAIGNFIDRAINGYVDDFIYFKLIDFPIFNLADIYVTVSMGLLIILVFFVYKDNDFDFLSLKNSKKDMENNGKN